ncbi:Nucleotide-binding universal stress protein, UspA family [Dethiosulfatibacter aminovorans DSM 17477]|uniref:Nucleotide-binding universal stress protein, UspA family n=1 Tax=Dethiosulfatibacter aminovorans DSM 17477 TaxID=1121476 RepID=A0A1M6AJ41_9FIRM|nr:universal stress protein [Dethiosulfatibacter aminovorans]SHI36233.1 Nucleotide-binding universal stress protein, UspA family [Dethiosulfatibacter aminovorans DSM 17477]
MKKILFPTDGSAECQKAYDMAEELAKKFDSEVTVFYVYDIHVMKGYEVTTTEEEGKKIIGKTVEYFKDRDVRVGSKIVKGYPAEAIIEEAEEGGYDLVIMCTHGMSARKRFMLGSVTNKVVQHVKVPMLVAR